MSQMIPSRRTPLYWAPLLVALTGSAIAAHAATDDGRPPAPGTAAPAPAAAASDSTSATKAAAPDVQSVEVTAQRRREPVKDIPGAVSAISPDQLQRSGAQSLRDYVSSVPGISLAQGEGSNGGSQITMRGISTGGSGTGPLVGVYVDDIAYGSSNPYTFTSGLALDAGLSDLSQIEILRGPQGTLYGANAMGGVIKYITNDPALDQFGGSGSVDVSSTQHGGTNYTIQAALDAPIITDVAGLHVSGFHVHDAGFIDDVGRGRSRIDRGDVDGARAVALFVPTKGVEIKLTGFAQDTRNHGRATQSNDLVTGAPTWGDLKTSLKLDQPFDQKFRLAGLTVDADFGWARGTSITSLQTIDTRSTLDGSGLYVPYLAPSLADAGLTLGAVGLASAFTTRKTTQEFRLVSPARPDWEWVAGLYYSVDHTAMHQRLDALGDDGVTPLPVDLATLVLPTRTQELAAYGDLTKALTRDWNVTLGVRESRTTQSFGLGASGLLGLPSVPATSGTTHVATYLFSSRYRIDADQTAYLRIASGYRPGGANPGLTDLQGNPISDKPMFGADRLWSYETGLKSTWIPHRLSTDVALYVIEWTDLQVIKQVEGVDVIDNARSARSTGAELSSTWTPTDAWRVDLAFSYIDAKLTADAPALSGLDGDRLPDTPHIGASLSGQYQFGVASGGTAYVGAAIRYVGSRNAGFNDVNTPNFALPAYSVIDLRAGCDFEKWHLGFYLKNATNRNGEISADTSMSALGAPAAVAVVQPRTVGMQAGFNF